MPTSLESDLGADAPATAATTFSVAVGGTAHGQIGGAGDVDYIAVDLVAGQTYTFTLIGIGTDALQDGFLRLYASDGVTSLAFNDDGLPNLNATFTMTATQTGTHYLSARAAGSGTGSYGVSASLGTKADLDAAMIAGVIDSRLSWSGTPGTAATLTFGFSDTITHGYGTFQRFSEGQKESTRAVLAHFAEVAGLTFTEVDGGNGYTDEAVLLYGNYSANDGSGAWGGLPGDPSFGAMAGDVWVNTDTPPTEAAVPGSGDYVMLLHEIGHTMGLSHPGQYDAGVGVTNTYETDAQVWQDSQQFTVMSYFAADAPTGADLPAGIGGSALNADSLGIMDMLALQQIYGANLTTRSGDSIYGFGSTEVGIYDFVQNIDPMLTIWDAGGTDTLNLSLYAADQAVDLTEGSHSSVGGYVNNLGIAYGAVIENAYGGRGDDSLAGNAVGNRLKGNEGSDRIEGAAGADSLYGGAGGDTLIGGAGDDLLQGEDSVTGVAAPQVFHLVETDPTQAATLHASAATLFPSGSFTLEMIWQQQDLAGEGVAASFGNFSIYRHADGGASLTFAGATEQAWNANILPPALTDGTAHRLSIAYDDFEGWLYIYLDGVLTLSKKFPSATRNLDATGDVTFGDAVAVGDIRIFDQVRTAQEIWDNAWTHLVNPAETPGLQHNWQGDGTGTLVDALPGKPALVPTGPVGTIDVPLQDASTANSLAGGAGDDTYHVYSALDLVTETDGQGRDEIIAHGDFTLDAGQSVERLTVANGSGGIALVGNAMANQLTSALADADTLSGGRGNDIYFLYHSEDQVIETALGGKDTINAFASHVLAAGSAVEILRASGNAGLSLTGNALANRFYSNAAHADGLADTLAGGGGNDRYYLYNDGDKATEAANGGARDQIFAYADHTLAAGSQVEAIYARGDAGRALVGNALANTFYSNAAHADTLSGGAGNDVYYLRHASDRVIEATGGGKDTIRTAVNHVLAEGSAVETLRAEGTTAITLTGNALANRLQGSASHDDTLRGGGGDDRYDLSRSGQVVMETSASGGVDQIFTTAHYTLAAGSYIEELHAIGTAAQRLTGNARANQLFSQASHADTLTGGAGDDTFWLNNATDRVIETASGGRDVILTTTSYRLTDSMAVEELRATGPSGLALTGNASANTLVGGSGADTLTAGAGRDQLFGGEDGAADHFVFRATVDSAVGANKDVIADFVSGQDRLDLSAIDANIPLAGNQRFDFAATSPASFGLWTVAVHGQLVIRLDVTGDARADMEIGITGIASLLEGDVLL